MDAETGALALRVTTLERLVNVQGKMIHDLARMLGERAAMTKVVLEAVAGEYEALSEAVPGEIEQAMSGLALAEQGAVLGKVEPDVPAERRQAVIARVGTLLATHGQMTRTELLRKAKGFIAREVDEALNVALEEDRLEVEKTKTKGRAKVVYRWRA